MCFLCWLTIEPERQLGEFVIQNAAFHSIANALIAGGLAACIDRAQKLCRKVSNEQAGLT